MSPWLRRNAPTFIALALVLVLGTLCHALSPAGAAPQRALSDNLVACWTLDETSGVRYDSTANDNDLTDNNTVGYISGKISNAADFDDANTEYLSIADNAYLSVGDEYFAVAAWVRLDDRSDDYALVAKYDTVDDHREYMLSFNDSGNYLYWYVSGNGTAVVSVAASTFGSVNAETWYFVFAYHDPDADEIGISVNNGAFDTQSLSGGINDDTSDFNLGAFTYGGSQGYLLDGQMDEVAIWNGGIPSAGEITSLYNSGDGLPCADIIGGGEPTATPTNTPTATGTLVPTSTGVPAYVIQSTLPSGNEFIIERSASFGQVVTGILLVFVVGLLLIGLVLRILP